MIQSKNYDNDDEEMEPSSITTSNVHHAGESNGRAGNANDKTTNEQSARRYVVRDRRAPQRYFMIALRRTQNEDESNLVEALKSKEYGA